MPVVLLALGRAQFVGARLYALEQREVARADLVVEREEVVRRREQCLALLALIVVDDVAARLDDAIEVRQQ